MYCMSCKTSTKNKNEKKSTSSNGRSMLKAECAECGTKKSKFVGGGASKPIEIPKKKQKGGMYNEITKQEYPEMEFIEEKPKKTKVKKVL